MTHLRIDKLLVERGLTGSRQQAVDLINQGAVVVNGEVISKVSTPVETEAEITLTSSPSKWVSRGALKLLAAIEAWNTRVEGKTCMDIGSSTGGFTQVLLENGAKHVYGIDAGHGQLHPSLRKDKRITNLEKTNIRYLKKNQIPDAIDLFTIDVSFISLTLVIPQLRLFSAEKSEAIALVKPQFEAGPENLDSHGIVRSEKERKAALEKVRQSFLDEGWTVHDTIDSPIEGGDGNREYLIHATR